MGAMRVTLVPISRENHRAMWRLNLKPEQQGFVSPPAWSLARCFVRVFGDKFEHLPHLIYAGSEPIGFSTIACDPTSGDDYWVDDIMIDERYQGQGYGRAAMVETIKLILGKYPRCRGIQLTCFRANTNAAALYLSLGFVLTGGTDEVFHEPNYKLSGKALESFR
jgi:diamine N-acetyltransferase